MADRFGGGAHLPAVAIVLGAVLYDGVNETLGLPDIRYVGLWHGAWTAILSILVFHFFWSVRRLHDMGASGYWAVPFNMLTPYAVLFVLAWDFWVEPVLVGLLGLWLFAGWVHMIWLDHAPSQPGPNAYGDPPY